MTTIAKRSVEADKIFNPTVVSPSEADQFLTCERKHYYAFGECLQLKSKGQAISRGVLGHSALAFFYEQIQNSVSRSSAKTLTIEFLANEAMKDTDVDYELITSLARLIEGYIDYYEEEDKQWEILAVEKNFLVEGTYPFTPDLIKRHYTTGEIRVVDHKFIYNFYDARVMHIASQLPKYKAFLEYIGFTVDSVEYDMIRHRGNAVEKYKRETVRVPKKRSDTFFNEHGKITNRILELKNTSLEVWEASVIRHVNMWTCKTCPFLDLCQTDLDGLAGRDLLVREFYEINTYGYKILEGDD